MTSPTLLRSPERAHWQERALAADIRFHYIMVRYILSQYLAKVVHNCCLDCRGIVAPRKHRMLLRVLRRGIHSTLVESTLN